jgi:uncharacterized protein (TIGR00156 family)
MEVLMKKQMCVLCVLLLTSLTAAGLFAQGYTGPTSSPALVSVAELKDLRDDTRVTLQGTIINQLSREKYTFRDASGEIVVEIEGDVWRRLSETISETDHVEIYGEVDKERLGTRIEIEVRSMRKL